MAEFVGSGSLADDAHLLRRIPYKSQAPRGVVTASAFRPKKLETSLSYYLRSELLEDKHSITQFAEHFKHPSGDLPGVCYLSCHQLRQVPPLQLNPRPDPILDDPSEGIYGVLHCASNLPDDLQQELIAAIVHEFGQVLKHCVPCSKNCPQCAA
ncbi:MAG TPA: hypothetical protein VNT79_02220 [Phycisphaerae bacterium]|nr:hypothetical protein [Phycisphaerae bacterium]